MLSLDANVIVVFLTVWILVFVLTKLFFNPIRRIRDKREERIQGNKRTYEKAIESCEKGVQEIELTIKKAKAEAESARDALAVEAQKEKGRLVAEISAECKSQVEQARGDLDRTMQGLKEKLEAEAADLAERIEKKLLN